MKIFQSKASDLIYNRMLFSNIYAFIDLLLLNFKNHFILNTFNLLYCVYLHECIFSTVSTYMSFVYYSILLLFCCVAVIAFIFYFCPKTINVTTTTIDTFTYCMQYAFCLLFIYIFSFLLLSMLCYSPGIK